MKYVALSLAIILCVANGALQGAGSEPTPQPSKAIQQASPVVENLALVATKTGEARIGPPLPPTKSKSVPVPPVPATTAASPMSTQASPAPTQTAPAPTQASPTAIKASPAPAVATPAKLVGPMPASLPAVQSGPGSKTTIVAPTPSSSLSAPKSTDSPRMKTAQKKAAKKKAARKKSRRASDTVVVVEHGWNRSSHGYGNSGGGSFDPDVASSREVSRTLAAGVLSIVLENIWDDDEEPVFRRVYARPTYVPPTPVVTVEPVYAAPVYRGFYRGYDRRVPFFRGYPHGGHHGYRGHRWH